MSFLFSAWGAAPRASASTSRLLLAPVARRMKSKTKRTPPSGSDGGLPVVNPERLTKRKQMKVLLSQDLPRFGKAGEIVCANRTHADTLRREEIGFPIEQSYYGQPAIPSTTAPTPRVALHDPLVQAAIAAVVPGFRFFAELPRNQKSKRGYYSRGMPRVTNMTGRLNRKNEDEQKRRAELISLGWRPDENTYEDGEPTDEVSKWVPGQKGERQ